MGSYKRGKVYKRQFTVCKLSAKKSFSKVIVSLFVIEIKYTGQYSVLGSTLCFQDCSVILIQIKRNAQSNLPLAICYVVNLL